MAEEKKPAAEEVLELPSEEPTKQLRKFMEKLRTETAEWAVGVEARRRLEKGAGTTRR